MFLFGNQKKETLRTEIDEFDDVLVGDFADSFHNLTFKDSMVLTWAKYHCTSEFILKGNGRKTSEERT